MRVLHFLAEQAVPFETFMHPPAYSAQKRAKFLHVPGRQVVKAVLLSGPAGYLIAVLPATHQLDLDRLSRELHGQVQLATEEQIAQLFRDCQPGALPPFGLLYGLPTILDAAVDPEATIVFEGHTHFQAVRMRCRDYERLEQPRRLAFSREPQASGGYSRRT